MEGHNTTDNYTPQLAIFSLINLALGEILPGVLTWCATFISSFCGLFLNVPLHIHIPPIIMEISQLCVWWIGGLAGLLTILTHIGYSPLKLIATVSNKTKKEEIAFKKWYKEVEVQCSQREIIYWNFSQQIKDEFRTHFNNKLTASEAIDFMFEK